MPDITKCTGEGKDGICPWRATCWWYLAPDNQRQSYMAAPYENEHCDEYHHYEGDRA